MFKEKRILPITVLFIATLAAFFIMRFSVASEKSVSEHYEGIKVFTEVLSQVKKNYVDEVEDKELLRGAIKGMLSSLDPHSAFMPPEAYRELKVNTKGEFGGLGIQISIRDGILTVIAPIEDTPAYRAGIKAGDKIIKINNEFTKDMSLLDAVSKMRGPKGTSVTITILRAGLEKGKDYTIVRDIIKIKSVKNKLIEDDIGYIKITDFQQKTGNDLNRAMKALEKKGMRSLILDLRNNPGGLLNASIDVASYFLQPEQLIVYIKDRQEKRTEYRSHKRSSTYDYPMIVLVNHGSASASEIVAGSLQDWGKAVILGTKTFGKGSVQTVIPLSDGSGLRLTTARYYTPNDRSIQAKGIEPDILVEQVSDGQGPDHPTIREKDLSKHLKNDGEDEEGGDAPGKQNDEGVKKDSKSIPLNGAEEEDFQLQRAVDLLKIWQVFKKIPEAA